MFNIAIVDDEVYVIDKLSIILDKVLFNFDIDYRVTKFTKPSDFFKYRKNEFDLLFLDIEMGEENGVTISKTMYEQGLKPIIVFVTSYEGYIKDAFGLNVYGYIMKEEIEERIPKIMHQILKDLNKKSYIILNNNMGPVTYRYSDILYFMIENRKLYVRTRSNLTRFYATTLKGIKNSLNNQFLQPNSKYIVNAQHIKSIENGEVIMSNEDHIFISRGKYRLFNEIYKDYLINEV